MGTGVLMCGVDDKMVIIVQPEIENGTRERVHHAKKRAPRKNRYLGNSSGCFGCCCCVLRCHLRLLAQMTAFFSVDMFRPKCRSMVLCCDRVTTSNVVPLSTVTAPPSHNPVDQPEWQLLERVLALCR